VIFFFWELEGTHSIDCHYFHGRTTLFKSGGANSQHRKLWAIIFKPGTVAEDTEWSFRVKGFTRQQIWTQDLCGTKTKGHRPSAPLVSSFVKKELLLLFIYFICNFGVPKFPNSTTLLSPLLLCPKVSPPFACTSRGATIGERALHPPKFQFFFFLINKLF
jgi:hypothetical protein